MRREVKARRKICARTIWGEKISGRAQSEDQGKKRLEEKEEGTTWVGQRNRRGYYSKRQLTATSHPLGSTCVRSVEKEESGGQE